MARKTLTARYRAQKTHILGLTPTGRKSAEVEYETLDANDEVLNTGVALCFDTDSVELDDDDCLTGDSILSASGEFIVKSRTVDRTGLGYKK
jgi:hypothetical protein